MYVCCLPALIEQKHLHLYSDPSTYVLKYARTYVHIRHSDRTYVRIYTTVCTYVFTYVGYIHTYIHTNVNLNCSHSHQSQRIQR